MYLNCIVILTTCPDIETARIISKALVENHLAACVNIIPGLESIYLWKGVINTDIETLLIIKTTNDKFDAVESMIKSLHPYELPELISLQIDKGLDKYLDWIVKSVQ